MKAALRKEWIDALRSDEYKQGRGTLKRDGEYCCLGVLCEILYKKEPDKYIWYGLLNTSGTAFKQKGTDNYSISYIPENIADEIELTQTEQIELGLQNDKNYQNFEQIALYIEEHITAE